MILSSVLSDSAIPIEKYDIVCNLEQPQRLTVVLKKALSTSVLPRICFELFENLRYVECVHPKMNAYWVVATGRL